MKKLLLLASMALCASCSNNWEYKIVTVKGESTSEFTPNVLSVSSEDLNLFGKDGWELIDTYATTESVHPNFGNDKYVSGLQPNVRTNSLNFVFKRRL